MRETWKNKWEKLWAKVPHLPRKWRVIRNLTAAALLTFLLPVLIGWPVFTPYGAFRQLEAKYLLTPSELVLRVDGHWGTGFLTEGESWVTVGKGVKLDGSDTIFGTNWCEINQVLSKEELVVAALPASNAEGAMVVAVTGAPEGAASGYLEVDLGDIPNPWHYRNTVVVKDETFSARAEREENGWFFFYLEPHPEEEVCAMEMLWAGVSWWETPEGYPYRLTLFDGDGNPVEQTASTLPADQRLRDW